MSTADVTPDFQADRAYAGLAPGVPHLANASFAVRHRAAGAAAAGGHLVNLPFASLHGAAANDVLLIEIKNSAVAAEQITDRVSESSMCVEKLPRFGSGEK